MSKEYECQFKVNLWEGEDKGISFYVWTSQKQIDGAISRLKENTHQSLGLDFYIRSRKVKIDKLEHGFDSSLLNNWKEIVNNKMMNTDFEINVLNPGEANFISKNFGLPFPFSEKYVKRYKIGF